jgi:hypothetical protein
MYRRGPSRRRERQARTVRAAGRSSAPERMVNGQPGLVARQDDRPVAAVEPDAARGVPLGRG